MNAIDFLIKEHEHVRKTLSEIDDSSHRTETKRKMFKTLCNDLIRHETMEQKVWYPHFKNNTRLNDEVKHLLSEEKTAEKILKKFSDIKTDQEWESQFIKLKGDVEHHADEEEQKLFPEVEKLLNPDDLEKIGIEMYHFKQNYSPSVH
jgi:F0F1-type ATP synthase gamma subunit